MPQRNEYLNKYVSKMKDRKSFNNICISHSSSLNGSYPLHEHDFHELVFILKGTGVQNINAVDYIVSAGDVFVLKGSDVHGFKEAENIEIFNIGYMDEVLLNYQSFLKNLSGYFALFYVEPSCRNTENFKSRLHLNASSLHEVSKLLTNIEAEFESEKPGHELMITSYFEQVVVFVSRKYFEDDLQALNKNLYIPSMTRVISYIENNYTEEISNDLLSSIANVSTNTLINNFKKSFNVTPTNYILNLRIRKACELLLSSNMSMTEIAMSVGFSDSNYFSRVFRKFTGLTPTEYRNSSP